MRTAKQKFPHFLSLSGDVESAVELLDGIYTSPNSTSPSMSFVFRKVLESDNDKALDKCKTPTRARC